MVPVSRETAEIQKMKNSGNEAKKYLKTKDITFFSAADYARFVRNLTPIALPKGQTMRDLHKTKLKPRCGKAVGAATNSRLHNSHATPAKTAGQRGISAGAGMAGFIRQGARIEFDERSGNVYENKGSCSES